MAWCLSPTNQRIKIILIKPKILMFAPFCYPPAGAEAIVTSKLLLTMLNGGWEIDVISQANAGQFYPVSEDDLWEPVKGIVKKVDGKIAGFKGGDNGLVGKAINKVQSLSWVLRAAKTATGLCSQKKYDFIFSRVAPQYGHLPALILSRKIDIPWVASWSDPMPPQKAPPPYGKGPFAKISLFLSKYYKEVAKEVSWHIFPSERLRDYVCRYLPECKPKSSVIPHVALNTCRRYKPLNDDFVLCHIGGLGLRDPKIFLEGVKLFLQREKINSSFIVKFVGFESHIVKEASKKLGIEDVVSMEKVRTYQETLDIAAASTVLVIIEAPCEEGIFFPSKFVDFVQTGRPILAVSPVDGTLHDILSCKGGGISADCRSAESVKDAITFLYGEWKRETLDENYASDRLLDLFSEHNVLDKYIEIFGRLSKKV